jgi:hypothetical protein
MAAMKWRSWLSFVYLLAAVLSACSTTPVPPAPLYPHGAINPDITQANIAQTICVSGWTATVRPAVRYTNEVKHKLMDEKGLPDSDARQFELDHYIPLALGGDPRSINNLWLQPWDGDQGAKKKDRLERRLQVMVCAGRLTLERAREEISKDWLGAYGKYVIEKTHGVTAEEEPVE